MPPEQPLTDLRRALDDTRRDVSDLRREVADALEEVRDDLRALRRNSDALVVTEDDGEGKVTVRPARVGIDLKTWITIMASVVVPLAAILVPILATR